MRAMTVIWEGRVAPGRETDLVEAFRSAGAHIPPQMLRSDLVRDVDDPQVWRAISVWRSREALDEYRAAVETPGALVMFRAAGSEPVRSISESVVES